MRFTLASVAALAFAVVSVSAQDPNFNDAYKPAKGEEIPAGKSYKVEWRLPASAKKGPISILLVGGPEQDKQQVLSTLETGYDNSKLSYDWSVDAGLGAMAFYGLKFQLDSDTTVFQWSNNFKIVGGSGAGNDTNTSKSASSSASSTTTTPPTSQSTMSTSTTTSVVTSGTTTMAPPTVSQSSTGGPAPTGTTPTPPANTTRPGTVPPNAAAGFSVSGPLAFVGGLAALMLVL